MVVGGKRTSSVPRGLLRPQNTLRRNPNSSSSLLRPNQKKVFNLQDGEYLIPDEHHTAKRQKLDPEQTTRNDSSPSVIDLSESHSLTTKGPVSRPKAVWNAIDPPNSPQRSATLEKSPHFAKQSKQNGTHSAVSQLKISNRTSNSPILVATPATKTRFSNSQVTHNAVEDVQYLDEDSIDLLKADERLPEADQEAGSTTLARGGLIRAPTMLKSHSMSDDGDIPQSAIAQVQPKSSQKKTRKMPEQEICFDIAYIRAGSEYFCVQKNCEPWQFQYDYDKNEFDLLGNGNSITYKWPRLVLKPGKIHKVMYNDESAKLVVRRAVEADATSSPTLLVQTQLSNDAARLVQCLKRLDDTIKFIEVPNEKLDKIFDNETKTYGSMKPRIKSQKSEEVSLLETQAARIGSRTSAYEQKQGRNSTIDEDNSAASPRRQSMVKKMTTISKDDGKSVHASESRLNDSELPSTRRTVKRRESLGDFRPTTRASAQQQNGERQLRPLKSRSPSPLRWTGENSRWQDERRWRTSLIYPAEGKQRTTVDARDIERLDEGEFLNDNLIAFYLRFLEVQLEKSHPELSKRIYFQNTYFYETLTKGRPRSNNINYDAVKRWSNKVDIFSYDYIIVPVCEKFHWYVAIICNAPKLLSPSEEDDQEPHEVDEIAFAETFHPPAVFLKDHQNDSLFMETPSTLHETSTAERLENLIGTDSASALLEDGNDEWSEPDALPEPSHFRYARLQNSRPHADLIGDLTVKDSFEEEIQPLDLPRKSKKLKRKSMPPPRKYDPSEPRIITLDSLGGAHSPICSNLRAYLVCEAKARKEIDITPGPLGMTATGLPQQSNYCDCGVFVLGYVKKFLQDPDTFVRSILQRDADRIKDWPEMDASKMRQSIRVLIFQLHAEQTQRENEQREAKSKAKKATKINVQRRLLFLDCESDATE